MNPYTHPDYPPFVAQIRGENPDDRDAVTRLVCADFLEEQGDQTRADLVRSMVRDGELKAAPRDIRRWFNLNGGGEVLSPNCANLTGAELRYWSKDTEGEFGGWADRQLLTVWGGFVVAAQFTGSALTRYFNDLYRREPVSSVIVTVWDEPGIVKHAGENPKRRLQLFSLAGATVEVPQYKVAQLVAQSNAVGGGNRERNLTELVMRHRWPGVRFEVRM